MTLEAPGDKGGKGRVGWLLRQLKDAPGGLVIEAYAKNSRNGVAASLEAAREDATLLLGPDKKDPAKFTLVARTELGMNRRSGRTPGFVESVIAAVESFYGDVLQTLTAYQRRAAKLPPRPPKAPEVEHEELPSVPLVEIMPPEEHTLVPATPTSETATPVIAAPATWFVSRP